MRSTIFFSADESMTAFVPNSYEQMHSVRVKFFTRGTLFTVKRSVYRDVWWLKGYWVDSPWLLDQLRYIRCIARQNKFSVSKKTQQKVSVFDLAMDCTSEGTA